MKKVIIGVFLSILPIALSNASLVPMDPSSDVASVSNAITTLPPGWVDASAVTTRNYREQNNMRLDLLRRLNLLNGDDEGVLSAFYPVFKITVLRNKLQKIDTRIKAQLAENRRAMAQARGSLGSSSNIASPAALSPSPLSHSPTPPPSPSSSSSTSERPSGGALLTPLLTLDHGNSNAVHGHYEPRSVSPAGGRSTPNLSSIPTLNPLATPTLQPFPNAIIERWEEYSRRFSEILRLLSQTQGISEEQSRSLREVIGEMNALLDRLYTSLPQLPEDQQPPRLLLPPTPVPAAPPLGAVPAAPPLGTVPQAPPLGTVPAAPPLGTVPQAPPLGTVPQAPPLGTVPAAPPLGTVPQAPPLGTVPAAPPLGAGVPPPPPLGAVPVARAVMPPQPPQRIRFALVIDGKGRRSFGDENRVNALTYLKKHVRPDAQSGIAGDNRTGREFVLNRYLREWNSGEEVEAPLAQQAWETFNNEYIIKEPTAAVLGGYGSAHLTGNQYWRVKELPDGLLDADDPANIPEFNEIVGLNRGRPAAGIQEITNAYNDLHPRRRNTAQRTSSSRFATGGQGSRGIMEELNSLFATKLRSRSGSPDTTGSSSSSTPPPATTRSKSLTPPPSTAVPVNLSGMSIKTSDAMRAKLGALRKATHGEDEDGDDDDD